MPAKETYNKIITTVNSITPNYEFIPHLNNCIVIDTLNNRIGINTIHPEENIHVSGGKIKCFDLIVLNNLSTNNVASDLIPTEYLPYNLGSIDFAWNDLYLGSGSFYMNKRKIIHIVEDISLLVIDNSYNSIDISDINHLNIRCDVSFNRNIEVTKDASINGILDVCGDLLLTNKSGVSTIYTSGTLIIDPSIHNHESGDVIIKGNLNVKGTTALVGDLTGIIQTQAQPNITSLGNLTSLQVDNINIDGDTIKTTGTNHLMLYSGSGTISTNNDNINAGSGTIEANTFSGNFTGTYLYGSINGNVNIGNMSATNINDNITKLFNDNEDIINGNVSVGSAYKLVPGKYIAGELFDGTQDIDINYANLSGTHATLQRLIGNADTHYNTNNISIQRGVDRQPSYQLLIGDYTQHLSNLYGAGGRTAPIVMFDVAVQIGRTINNHNHKSGMSYYGVSLATIGDIVSDGDIYTKGVKLGSDDRIKHNEVSITNGLEIIRQLNAQKYIKTNSIDDTDISNGSIEIGFIAQDILIINDLSFSVTGGDNIDESGNIIPSKYYLNYNNIFSYNVAATKELDIEVEKLKEENKILKSTLNSLLVDLGREPVSL